MSENCFSYCTSITCACLETSTSNPIPSSASSGGTSAFYSKACFATGKRLLASIVNEGLMNCLVLESQKNNLYKVGIFPKTSEASAPLITFYIRGISIPQSGLVEFFHPDDVCINNPIMIGERNNNIPSMIFQTITPYLKGVESTVFNQIKTELDSSVHNQEIAYENQREPPTLESSSLEWEQNIIEGHSTHPMHRTRIGLSDENSKKWSAECRGQAQILFISIPKNEVSVFGDFEKILSGWLPNNDSENHAIVPIHEGQYRQIQKYFPNAKLIPGYSKSAWAQTSIRTVAPLDLDYQLKFALAVQATSALRTISPYSVWNGPKIGQIAKMLAPKTLHIIDELASVGSNLKDYNVAKHMACIVREDPEKTLPDQKHIICAALSEKDSSNVPHAISALKLETEAQREEFFARYVELFLDCFLPPMMKGLAFEAHGQNTLARFDSSGNLLGFSIRDFGGLMYHKPTVFEHTQIDLPILEGSSILAETLEDAYKVFFHAGIQHHLRSLLRALSLGQTNSEFARKGVEVIRENIKKHISSKDLLNIWLGPKVHYKCLLSMRIDGLYRDYLYKEVPNYLYKE